MKSAITLACLLLVTQPAPGCELQSPPIHRIDPEEAKVDHVPPSAPQIMLLGIKRGRGDHHDPDGTIWMDTCDHYGAITISIPNAPVDDRTKADELGYRWKLVSGKPPDGLAEPVDAQRLMSTPRHLALTWDDGYTDDQEPFAMQIVVIAVDRAGNENASCPIWVKHPGTSAEPNGKL